MTAPDLSPTERVVVARFGLDRPDPAVRIRELEREARDEYDALRADETASVADLVGAEARVVALATAADIAEGKAF